MPDRDADNEPVRALVAYLRQLHVKAGRPPYARIGRAVSLAPSTLSGFFTGARPISPGNLELIVEYLGGDVARAERLRRKAADAYARPVARDPIVVASRAVIDRPPVDLSEATARLDIVVYETPTNKLNRPERLFGREELSATLRALLDRGERVLLHGLTGSGKTALAATLADAWVESGAGPYVWLEFTTADADVVFDALLRRLSSRAEQVAVNASAGDARLLAIRDVLGRSRVKLCVLDDVWNAEALYTILRAVPDGMPVLVTSRFKIDLPHQFDVARIEPAAATQLLAEHSRQPVHVHDPDVARLCHQLVYHAYAIEIAGHHVRQYGLTPAELRAQISDPEHELAMPNAFAKPGRTSLDRMLDQSVEMLTDPDARAVLTAFGAFVSGGATVELLARYLDLAPTRVRTALHRLVDVSLARRQDAAPRYVVHDLIFRRARALRNRTDSDAAALANPIAAARVFVTDHKGNFDLLGYELENLLGAAEQSLPTDVDSFLAIVEALTTGGYLDERGHPLELLRALDRAIELLQDRPDGSADRLHYLLSKRGNAHYNRGEHEQAVAAYREAAALAPTPYRTVVLLAVTAKVLAGMGSTEESTQEFSAAYTLAESTGDDRGMLFALEQHSDAAFRQADFALVRKVATRGLEISQKLGDLGMEAVFRNNLGSAEFEIGVRASLALHGQAHAIALKLDEAGLIALTHRTMGIDYHAREDYAKASAHLHEALRRYRELGHTDAETKVRAMMEQFGYLPQN